MKRPIEIGENLMFLLIVFIITAALLIASVLDSKAQTVTLPTWVADSLIFEAKLSRQCSQVVQAQAEEIRALGVELSHTNKALILSYEYSNTLSHLIENAKESNQILTQQFALNLKTEKRKTKRWRKVAILETLGFVGLLIIVL